MRHAILTLFVLFVFTSIGTAEELTFEWDYPADVSIDGFTLYSGPMGQYDDGTWGPKYNDVPLLDNIGPSLRKITVDEPGWEGVSKKFCFAIDAFKGSVRSTKSNFVCKVIDNTAPVPAPKNVFATWDKINNSVTISWEQDDLDNVKQWKVFYRPAEIDSEFKEIGSVANDGTLYMTLTTAVEGVSIGETKDLIFVVVALNGEVFSPNSQEVIVTIDRTEDSTLPDPTNLRFSVTIPVE